MSTMYYSWPGRVPIGQVHSLGKNKGYHFTWCIWPLEFYLAINGSDLETDETIINEYAEYFTFSKFQDIVRSAKSQSFDERIE